MSDIRFNHHPRHFGYNLRRIRKHRGLNVKQLGEFADIPRAVVSRYEHGHALPGLNQLYKLAYVLDCSIDNFLREPQL